MFVPAFSNIGFLNIMGCAIKLFHHCVTQSTFLTRVGIVSVINNFYDGPDGGGFDFLPFKTVNQEL